MTLLLDTSILVDLEREKHSTRAALKEIAKEHPTPAFIPFVTLTEFLVGIEKLPLYKKATCKELLWHFPVIHTTNETALILSKLKYEYDKKGSKKSFANLFIASQAIEHNMTLVTKDADFKEISELKKVVI